MHQNFRFNIVQAPGNCNPKFVVIDGQRTASGHMTHGSKVLTGEMNRSDAIKEADRLQAAADQATTKFEIRQEEPEGWLRAFVVYGGGKELAAFSFRDNAQHYIERRTA